jgi:hypothetical protein
VSGGSYEYIYSRIGDVAREIRDDGGCGEGYCARPSLRRAFKTHLHKVAAAMRAIEWNDSGDGDDRETELINECLSPSAELVQAIADAAVALDALERARKAASREVGE